MCSDTSSEYSVNFHSLWLWDFCVEYLAIGSLSVLSGDTDYVDMEK